MNLGQLIGGLQLRLAECEPFRRQESGRAGGVQDKIMAYIEEQGGVNAQVSNADIQVALSISENLTTATLSRLVKAKRVVHTGERRHYRYAKAPA